MGINEVVAKAYKYARDNGITKSSIIGVIDFTKPSNVKRFQIIEMNERRIIIDTWVTHGINSGKGAYAKYFSNIVGSWQSSIGVYKCNGTYISKIFGRALIMDGLEKGFNDKVRIRAIVLHKSSKIGNGQTGHSKGCFAVPTNVKDRIIDILKAGHIIIAYYPDPRWLNDSVFLNSKEGA